MHRLCTGIRPDPRAARLGLASPNHRLELELRPCLYYEPARALRNVTVVLAAIEIRGAYELRYSEDTDSNTVQLDFNTFMYF